MTVDLLEKRKVFDRFLNQTKSDLSSYSFVNLFVWRDFFNFDFDIIDDHLCVFANNDLGSFLYLPPLGKSYSCEIIHRCFQELMTRNGGKGISRIENVEKKDLDLFDDKDFIKFEKSKETIYKREDIAGLKGNCFKSKRSSYNHFLKNHNFKFHSYEESMESDCLSLYKRWAIERKKDNDDFIYHQMIDDSAFALKQSLEYYQLLGLAGKIIYVDGDISGFTFGFTLKEDTFCVLFEITDLSFRGISTYLFSEFCRSEEVKPFLFINVMDDFGLDNIGKTKLSFNPDKQVSTYTISPKD